MSSVATAQAVPTPSSSSPATPASWAPTAKVSAGVLASAVTILIIEFVPHASAWTPAAAGAITQLVTFVVQYMVPERK